MMMGLVLALSFGSSPVLVMPLAGEFVLFDQSGEVIERIATIDNLRPLRLAAGAGGIRVFTAQTAELQHPALWVHEPGSAPRRIGHTGGLHDWPSLSADGKWVYFSWHRDPEFMLSTREYGQIWKVRLDGSSLEQITTSRGCKMHPQETVSGGLIYSHTLCEQGIRGIETVGLTGESNWLFWPSDAKPGQAAIAPQSGRLALTRRHGGRVEVVVSGPTGTEARVVAAFPDSRLDMSVGWLGESSLIVSDGRNIRRIGLSSQRVVELPLAPSGAQQP